MATYQGVDTPVTGRISAPSTETRVLVGGTLIGLGVGVGLAFVATILGIAFVLAHPALSEQRRDVVFLAPFAGGMVLVLSSLLVPVVRRMGGGLLVGVMVGAAATLAVAGGVLAGSLAQSL